MSDRPDFTLPVSIVAYTIETLPIDIIAQTIGNIEVNVQTAGGVNILLDLLTRDATYPTRRWISNQGTSPVFVPCVEASAKVKYFARGMRGTILAIKAYGKNLDTVDSRFFTVSISHDLVTWTTLDTIYFDPEEEDEVETGLAPIVRWHHDHAYVRIIGDHANMRIGRDTTSPIDGYRLSAGNWIISTERYYVQLEIDTTDTVPIGGEVNVDITAQTIGNIDIDIAAQTVGNITVSIDAQTVDLNIKTSGGVNIIIDKLTQTAYTERRSTVSNNGDTPSWTSVIGANRSGKYFPRGMRGFINTIDIYCKDAAAAGGNLYVFISPHPSMGYIKKVTLAVPAEQSEGWLSATFDMFWNYDSLFIYLYSTTANVQYGYDNAVPYDAYTSDDTTATWTVVTTRYWFRVIMTAQTIGDIPVSGTVNTIDLPAVTGDFKYSGSWTELDGGASLLIFLGTATFAIGKTDGIMIRVRKKSGTILVTDIDIEFVIDGITSTIPLEAIIDCVGGIVNTISPISMALIDDTNKDWQISFNKAINFNRSCVIRVYNTASAGNKIEVKRIIQWASHI